MHERITVLMSLVLDGVATPPERLRLDQHLAMCPDCAAVWKEWQSVDELLSTALVEAPSHSLTGEILAQLERRRRENQSSKWLPLGLLTLWVLWVGISLPAAILSIWWVLRHPMHIVVLVASGVQLVSAVGWFLRSIRMLTIGLDAIGAVIAWISCLTIGGALIALWLWVAQRSSGRARAIVPEAG